MRKAWKRDNGKTAVLLLHFLTLEFYEGIFKEMRKQSVKSTKIAAPVVLVQITLSFEWHKRQGMKVFSSK